MKAINRRFQNGKSEDNSHNPSGLHLRPAGILCNEAIKYSSAITFTFEGGTAKRESVLSVLGACVKCGG